MARKITPLNPEKVPMVITEWGKPCAYCGERCGYSRATPKVRGKYYHPSCAIKAGVVKPVETVEQYREYFGINDFSGDEVINFINKNYVSKKRVSELLPSELLKSKRLSKLLES